ncbi:MAG TPA: hypothetical protein VHB21_01450, partial [Minicystis sp.]|nr:hypothetical protein [Minicystis sp.]
MPPVSASYLNPPTSTAAVTLPVATGTRRVTYVFDTKATTKCLRIPYAVAIDGKVGHAFDDKPARVGDSNKIEVDVSPGAKVSLFLNSDAHPSHRKHAVYEVTAHDHHVEVKITEKKGKHATPDTPSPAGSDAAIGLDKYSAVLTGDIWMKVTHAYTSAEADALMPAGTPDAVRAAVCSIYGVLPASTLSMTVPATPDAPEKKLKVTFSDSSNPKDNITSYALLSDGLPRVHPAGYAAIFTAALAAGVP